MTFVKFSQFNNSSKRDANTVAPRSCSAKNEMNIVNFTDIALAVSVFLCLIFSIINIISIISIICVLSILALGIILLNKMFEKRQPTAMLN